MIIGVVPFAHWREKDRIIAGLRREFQNKVKIQVEEGFVHYLHHAS